MENLKSLFLIMQQEAAENHYLPDSYLLNLEAFIASLIKEKEDQILFLITEEMLIADKEKTPISRLTSLYIKIIDK